MAGNQAHIYTPATRLSEAVPALSMLCIGIGLLIITTGRPSEGFGAIVLGVGIGLVLPVHKIVTDMLAAVRKR